MNLTGHWKGDYFFGSGYPDSLLGKSEPFDFFIVDNEGSISGSCIDNVVRKVSNNESYIIGTFSEKLLKFKKRYKVHTGIDENGNHILDHDVKTDGVDYIGTLKRKMFSKSYYFVGEWSITSRIADDTDGPQYFICRGKWKMKRVN